MSRIKCGRGNTSRRGGEEEEKEEGGDQVSWSRMGLNIFHYIFHHKRNSQTCRQTWQEGKIGSRLPCHDATLQAWSLRWLATAAVRRWPR